MELEIFEIYRYEIAYRHFNEPVYLIPFGDIHRSAPSCHEEKWLEFLDWAKGKPRAYFLGMGDYDDLVSASERKLLHSGDLHESTEATLDYFYRKQTERLAKELSFMKGRLIGLLEGNHYVIFKDGTSSTQYLCKLLDCKYLGVTAFVRLSLKQATGHNSTMAVDVWAYHGKGAARLVGGSLNAVEQMAENAEADIYLMGHDHKKSGAPLNRLRLRSGSGRIGLSHRKCILARTGSFLRGYVPGCRTYVARQVMKPTDLGVVKIEITPKRAQTGGDERAWPDLHVSI